MEAEVKSRFFFLVMVWGFSFTFGFFFFFNSVEKSVRVTVILQVFFLILSEDPEENYGMGVDEMASSLHVDFFPELEILSNVTWGNAWSIWRYHVPAGDSSNVSLDFKLIMMAGATM